MVIGGPCGTRGVDNLYILAVVGEPLAERLLRRYLNTHGFYSLVVTTEEEALDALDAFPVDVVVIDVDSVDFNVTTLGRLMKYSSLDMKPVSTIVIAKDIRAHMSEEEERECVDALLSKPAHPRDLVETIEAIRLDAKRNKASR